MRYRLRTLALLTAVGPPAIAVLWLSNDVRDVLYYGCIVAALTILTLCIAIAHIAWS